MQTTVLQLFCVICGAANSNGELQCFACGRSLLDGELTSSVQADPNQMQSLVVGTQSSLMVSHLTQRYNLLGQIGTGGFGVVYQAQDRYQHDRQVAIKQINMARMSTRDSIEATASYNREVSLLSKLSQEHLPRIYDHFTDAEHWYLVMEFIQGETLEDYLAKIPGGKLPFKEVLGIGLQLCCVLRYLHEQYPPIIFRDVKPANIMRNSAGHLYLIDFGIARRFILGQSKDTAPLGSPGYAAPEQYGLMQTTARTDIYGLGATLQTLLTGKDPLDLQLDDQAMLPIPKRLQRLLKRMQRKEMQKRPHSILHVYKHMKAMQQGRWRPYLKGLSIGVLPYLALGLLYLVQSHNGSSDSVFMPLTIMFGCMIPLFGLGILVTSLVMLFLPLKRYLAWGMLTPFLIMITILFLGVHYRIM